MRNRLASVGLVAGILMLIDLSTVSTRAQQQGAVTRVLANVPATVAISPLQPLWDVTLQQIGSFSATLAWRVEANVTQLQMMVEASDLFKADDPTNTAVPPIPLDTSRPVLLTAEHANQANAGGNKMVWIGPGAAIGGFPTNRTETITLESSQQEIFSQLVTTQIFYNQQEVIKPMGQYSGRVKITTMIPATATIH